MRTTQHFLTTSNLGFGDDVDSATGAETHEQGDWEIDW